MSAQDTVQKVDEHQPIADKELKDCFYCRHYRMAALHKTDDGYTIRCWSNRPPVRRVVFDSGMEFECASLEGRGEIRRGTSGSGCLLGLELVREGCEPGEQLVELSRLHSPLVASFSLRQVGDLGRRVLEKK